MLIVMLSLCRGGRSCSLYASMLYLACSAEVYVNTRLTISWSSPVRRSRHRVRDCGEYHAVTLQAEVTLTCMEAEKWHVMGGDGTWCMWCCVCSVPSSIYRKTERMRWCHEAALHLQIEDVKMRILCWPCTCWHRGDTQYCRMSLSHSTDRGPYEHKLHKEADTTSWFDKRFSFKTKWALWGCFPYFSSQRTFQ